MNWWLERIQAEQERGLLMNHKVKEKRKEAMLKRYENRMKDKLAEEGISKEWMKDHLIIDMGGD